MEKNTKLPEILIASSDKKLSAMITRLKKEEKLQKIASRVYTTNLTDTPENIVRRNLYKIIGQLYPGALISHRSAFELRPSADGHLYLTYGYTKKMSLCQELFCTLWPDLNLLRKTYLIWTACSSPIPPVHTWKISSWAMLETGFPSAFPRPNLRRNWKRSCWQTERTS